MVLIDCGGSQQIMSCSQVSHNSLEVSVNQHTLVSRYELSFLAQLRRAYCNSRNQGSWSMGDWKEVSWLGLIRSTAASEG